jgi:hypothetical protein
VRAVTETNVAPESNITDAIKREGIQQLEHVDGGAISR